MRSRAAAVIAASTMLLAVATGCKIETGNRDTGTSAPADSVINTGHVQKADRDWLAGGRTFKPTAIVLHWSDGAASNNVGDLVQELNGNRTGFDLNASSTDPHPPIHHTTVQLGVTRDGTAYQLTPSLTTPARHATCANAYAIGIEIMGSGPGSGHYIGDNNAQFKGVVAVVRELMNRYDIPAVSEVDSGGRTGRGVISHAMADAKCTWKDGVHYGSGKVDVDPKYLKRVLTAVG